MANIGVHVYRQATAGTTRQVAEAEVGIPFFVGTAPVHTAAKASKANVPVRCTSWEEAVEKLGYSEDWEKYTLCEAMYSHFKLFGCRNAVFCNVLDPTTMKTATEDQKYAVTDRKVTLPLETIADDSLVVKSGENTLTPDTDYSVFYDGDACVVELLPDYSGYSTTEKLNITSSAVNLSAVTQTEIALGVAQADACMTAVSVVTDLICAPGWSHDPVVAAVMATKAGAINWLFKGKAVIDADSSENGVTDCSQLADYKKKNNLVDENQIVCWPMARMGDHTFHLSTQLCGLMATVDAGNRGVPYESPSNKNLKMDACVLSDGTEVNLMWDKVNLIAGSWGVVTAVKFMDTGWVAKGNYTACYPENTDIMDQFIPVSRMFDFIGNTLIRTIWPKLDKPMTQALRDSILQTCNIWLGGLCGSGYLYGARCELRAEENPMTSIMDGIITMHVYNAPPVPAQEIDFILEYDVSYMEAAMTA